MVSRSSPPAESKQHQLKTQELQGQRGIKTGALQQEASLRNDSLTAQQWSLIKPKLFNSPSMMGVVAAQQGNPWACIQQHRHNQFVPKSVR